MNKYTNFSSLSVTAAIALYLDSVALARSANTARTYGNALSSYVSLLDEEQLDPKNSAVNKLSVDTVSLFATALKPYSPATERFISPLWRASLNIYLLKSLLSPICSACACSFASEAAGPDRAYPSFHVRISS